MEDVVVECGSSKTALAQLDNPRVDGRFRAICHATGYFNLVNALELRESFNARNIGRVFFV